VVVVVEKKRFALIAVQLAKLEHSFVAIAAINFFNGETNCIMSYCKRMEIKNLLIFLSSISYLKKSFLSG